MGPPRFTVQKPPFGHAPRKLFATIATATGNSGPDRSDKQRMATPAPIPNLPFRQPASPPPMPGSSPGASPSLAIAGESPLTQSQLSQLKDAEKRVKLVRRAAGVARFNGWTAGVIGGLAALTSGISLLFDLPKGDLSSAPGVLVGLALVGCAINELRAGARVWKLQPSAVTRLVINQGIIFAVVAVYSVVQVFVSLRSASALASAQATGNPEVDAIVGDLAAMVRPITIGFYVLVVVILFIVQALTAMFYHRRHKMIADYRRDTPPWIAHLHGDGTI